VVYYKEERVPLTTDRAMRAAPFLFVLLWSSSFITTEIGLRHISPLLFVAIRLVSGLCLCADGTDAATAAVLARQCAPTINC
jgi:drug/metabolite transporter (DMT)-like permease